MLYNDVAAPRKRHQDTTRDRIPSKSKLDFLQTERTGTRSLILFCRCRRYDRGSERPNGRRMIIISNFANVAKLQPPGHQLIPLTIIQKGLKPTIANICFTVKQRSPGGRNQLPRLRWVVRFWITPDQSGVQGDAPNSVFHEDHRRLMHEFSQYFDIPSRMVQSSPRGIVDGSSGSVSRRSNRAQPSTSLASFCNRATLTSMPACHAISRQATTPRRTTSTHLSEY